MKRMMQMVDEHYSEMVARRRFLHQHPELSFQEQKTMEYVYRQLQDWGIEATKNVGGYGVLGIIRGDQPGQTVALRADMDALPIQDEKECAYRSTVPGVMHACGHDGHTATLLEVARIINSCKHLLKGNVKLIFQPAEEISPGGAKSMIEAGVLEGVDAVFGVHLWTPLAVGTAASIAGPFMAAADEFFITIHGQGGHGGLPHETVDSVLVGSHLVVNLQSIVSRSVNPIDPAVVSVGAFQAGKSFNVIAEKAFLTGTVRTFDEHSRQLAYERLSTITEQTCAMFGATAEIQYKWGYPVVYNDEKETDRFFRVASDLMGQSSVSVSQRIMAGEDFAYYLQNVPGVFMFVGAGNEKKGIIYPHHHPKFDIDEEAMRHAAKLLIAMAWDRLNSSESTHA